MAEICRRHVQFEIQALAQRYVAAGIISTETAQVTIAVGLPLAAKSIKHLRMRGLSVPEVTAYLAERVAEANTDACKFAAELYAAIWTGMQADFRETYGREIGA
jgi:hypothetical protein